MKSIRVQKACFTGLLILFTVLFFMPRSSCGQDKNQAYWTDSASAVQKEQINLTAGETRTLRLITEIPAGKTLKAYSIMVEYDSTVCAVNEVNPVGGSALSPKNINSNHPAQVTINGFDIHGVSGPAAISLIDVTLGGKSCGTFD
jgi:hypothetical protein